LSYKERVSKIQNIGGLATGSLSLAASPTKMKNGKPYSVRITKPDKNGAKPTLNDLLGIHSPTRTSQTKDSLSPTPDEDDDAKDKEEEHAKTNSKSVRFDDGKGNEQKDKEEDDDDEFDDENWDAINEDIANVLAENFSQKNLIKDVHDEQSESMNINGHNEESKSVDDQEIEAQISPQLRVLSGSFVEKKSEDIYDDDDVEYDLDVDTNLMNGADNDESSDDEKNVIGELHDDQMYEFAYGFLRDVVYDQMLHNQRKQLHTNALKYIATCLKDKMDDKLALLHTRHIECIQKYSDMLSGEDASRSAHQPKRQSFFSKKSKK